MEARLVHRQRATIGDGLFEELVIWVVPQPLRGSTHRYKYRLAFVVRNVCVVRYDNEAGKGDHKHIGTQELPYVFVDVRRLVADFRADVRRWMDENPVD